MPSFQTGVNNYMTAFYNRVLHISCTSFLYKPYNKFSYPPLMAAVGWGKCFVAYKACSSLGAFHRMLQVF